MHALPVEDFMTLERAALGSDRRVVNPKPNPNSLPRSTLPPRSRPLLQVTSCDLSFFNVTLWLFPS